MLLSTVSERRSAVHSYFLQIIVDGKSARLKYFAGFGCISKLCITAHLGIYPRHQLQRIKRFRHIIVRSYIQARILSESAVFADRTMIGMLLSSRIFKIARIPSKRGIITSMITS